MRLPEYSSLALVKSLKFPAYCAGLVVAVWTSFMARSADAPSVGPPLRLTSPQDYQVHQRSSRTQGRIDVAGFFQTAITSSNA